MTGVGLAYFIPLSLAFSFSFSFGVSHNGVASSATNTLAVVNLCRGQHAKSTATALG